MKHPLPAHFISRAVRVTLVGCGGNGSQMLTGLARMHIALRSLGHPGLTVTVHDPDRVSESNVGRQLFSLSDVGHYKSILLVHRLNTFFQLDWKAETVAFPAVRQTSDRFGWADPDLVIGCVDTAASRRAIWQWGHRRPDQDRTPYWLDLGNLSDTGQVVLGQFTPRWTKADRPSRPLTVVLGGAQPAELERELESHTLPRHLPNVADLFPSILDPRVPESDIPSCSLAEALEKQDLFVNQAVSTFALQLLWTWFRKGGIDHHGYFIDLASGRVNTLDIDRPTWLRLNPELADAPRSAWSHRVKSLGSRVKRKPKA